MPVPVAPGLIAVPVPPKLGAPAHLTAAPNEPFVNQALVVRRYLQTNKPEPLNLPVILSVGHFQKTEGGASVESALAAAQALSRASTDNMSYSVRQAADGSLMVGETVWQLVAAPNEQPKPYSLDAEMKAPKQPEVSWMAPDTGLIAVVGKDVMFDLRA